jgi:cytochrome c
MQIGMRFIIGLLSTSGLMPLPLSADDTPVAADVQAGRTVYDKCIACHSPDRNRTGPMHCGVLGRAAGTVPGFNYSNAMRSSGVKWGVETLDRFLEAPLDMIPGTSMGFAGLSNETERRQLIAWLATLTPSSTHCDGVAFDKAGDKHEYSRRFKCPY